MNEPNKIYGNTFKSTIYVFWTFYKKWDSFMSIKYIISKTNFDRLGLQIFK